METKEIIKYLKSKKNTKFTIIADKRKIKLKSEYFDSKFVNRNDIKYL